MAEPIRVSELEGRLLSAANEAGGISYALLQGYPATCFARIEEGKIELPPAAESIRRSGQIPWEQFFDIRMFGGGSPSEVHAWRLASGDWGIRSKALAPGDSLDPDRTYPIYGDQTGTEEGAWQLYWDGRGFETWIPKEKAVSSKLVLRIRHEIGPVVPKAGVEAKALERLVPLVGIVDAVIIDIEPAIFKQAGKS